MGCTFSKKTIDDEWDFREEFRNYYKHDFHFITGFHESKPVMLLPLQYNSQIGKLEVYGGDDTDDNRILTIDGFEKYKDELVKHISMSTYLAPLAEPLSPQTEVEFYVNRYVLDLSGIVDYQDYIEKFWSGKSRNNLRRQMRTLYRNVKIEVIQNNYEDIDRMVELNKKTFGEKSSFHDPIRIQIFKDFFELYNIEMLSIRVNGVVEGVSYAIKYGSTYLSMNVGVNHDVRDVGKLLILLQIDRAISLGCTLYDAGKGDNGWKEAFHFTSIPQYKVTLLK